MKTVLSLLLLCLPVFCANPARAGLKFEKTELAHKATHAEKEFGVEFKFKVTGGKTIKIQNIDTFCSCLKAKTKDGRMEFKDGEEGIIETAFELGSFEGEVAKQVVVITDDPAQREITLTVRVTIPPIYRIEPEHLIWTLGEEAKPKTMKFTILDKTEIVITGLFSSRDNMGAELKEITKGREYEITLTPKTTAEPMIGVLRVETNAPYSRYQKRLLFFNVNRPKVPPSPKP